METINTYISKLKAAISTGEIKPETRKQLREFRIAHKISAERHLDVLEKLDWTMDDYEVRLYTVI